MATHRIPLLGWSTVPDTSGNVFFEPYDIKATNDIWDRLICVFMDTATRLGLHGGFTVPKNYVSAPVLVIVWTSVTTTGDCVWDFDYRTVGGNDTTSLDQTGTEQAVTVTDAAPTAAHSRLEATVALTAANFAADEEVEFTFFRDGADAADTLADAAMLFQLLWEYSDA